MPPRWASWSRVRSTLSRLPRPTPLCLIRPERSPRRSRVLPACSPPMAGARTRSCAFLPAWRSISRIRWRVPWSMRHVNADSSIASAMLPSSTSWRTASLRPSKGVAQLLARHTLCLRMRARSSSPTLRNKSSSRCRVCRRCIWRSTARAVGARHEDPLKPGVREAIADLHALGVKHVVMLTGDSERTAERIAREAGVDEFKAELLPEDKYAYVERIKSEGRHVAMVGDGVNDSPALGLADVGLAMGGGSDIAKEVADIILTDTDLAAIVRLRRMSQGLVDRLTSSYSKVMLTNSALLALGITGAITPQASSLLHNGSTIAYGLSNAKAYLR
ncbi:MAG: HAD-IC family P-type ATPase [Collinsella aerofaciens]